MGKSGTSRIFARSSSADTKRGPSSWALRAWGSSLPARSPGEPPRRLAAAPGARRGARTQPKNRDAACPARSRGASPGAGPSPARTAADDERRREAQAQGRAERVGEGQPGVTAPWAVARDVAQDDQRELRVGEAHPEAAEREDRHGEPRRHVRDAGQRRCPPIPMATTGNPTRTNASCANRGDSRACVHDPAVQERVAAVSASPAAAADQPRTSTRSRATYASIGEEREREHAPQQDRRRVAAGGAEGPRRGQPGECPDREQQPGAPSAPRSIHRVGRGRPVVRSRARRRSRSARPGCATSSSRPRRRASCPLRWTGGSRTSPRNPR